MGFSLSNLLRQGEAQVNPFDHGQTAATVRQQQARPAVAQLPAPGQPRPMAQPQPSIFQRAMNTVHNDMVAPVQRDFLNPTLHAAGNVGHAGGNIVNALSAHNINRVAESNFNPTHLVQNFAVKPGMELGAGIGANLYNHAVAPVFNLPKQQLTNAFSQSQEAQHIAHLGFGQQAANALNLASNALPGGGKLVEGLAAKGGAKVAARIGDNLAGKVAGKVAQKGIQYTGNAAIGGGMGYGLGAGSTLAQGGTLKQANQAGLSNAKIGALLGGGGTAALDIAPHAIRGAQTATGMAKNLGLKPPTNLTPEELASSNKILNSGSNGFDVTSADAHNFNNAQKKLGVTPGTPEAAHAVSNALDAHTAFNNRVMQRAQALQDLKAKFTSPAPLNEGGYIRPDQIHRDIAGKFASKPQPAIPPHLQALAEEAKKYKSADEFVKSFTDPSIHRGGMLPTSYLKTPKKLYRGVNTDGNGVGSAGEGLGLYTTTDKKTAMGYAKDGGKLLEMNPATDIPKNPLYFRNPDAVRSWIMGVAQKLGLRVPEFNEKIGIENLVNSLGHDGVAFDLGNGVAYSKYGKTGHNIFNELGVDNGKNIPEVSSSTNNIRPKDGVLANSRLSESSSSSVLRQPIDKNSNLTDLYNQAHANTPKKPLFKPLNSEGKALVSEDGSVIPTIKKLAGKGKTDPLAPLKQEALKYKSPEAFIEASRKIVPEDMGVNSADVATLVFGRGQLDEAGVKAKLTDFYNQAHAGAKSVPKQPSKPLPKAEATPATVSKRTGSSAGSIAPTDAPTTKPTLPAKATAAKPTTPPAKPTIPKGSAASSKSTPESIGKALGMSDGQIADAKAEQLASKTPAVQKPKSNAGVSKEVKKQLTTTAKNLPKDRGTAQNNLQVHIPEIQPGNFEQARINPQLAAHPIDFSTGQALAATKKLGLTTSEFGKMVEGTVKPTTDAQKAAVAAYHDMTDRTHAASQAVGGSTPYVKNYFRHEWDLSKPEDAAKFEQLARKGGTVDPYSFAGLNNQPRVFKTIAQGEAAGFKLKNQNLGDEITKYGKGASFAIKQQALRKAITEADMGEPNKTESIRLGNGETIPVSSKAFHEFHGYDRSVASNNPLVKGYRTGNRGFKQALLSVSEFHPINISVLKAGPTLAFQGHPVSAAKGVIDTFAAQALPKYSNMIQTAAYRDGTIEASARLGTPIKFGSDYAKEGKIGFGKGGLGEKAIFERAMPAMHIQMVKSAVHDLQKADIPLDSPQAHALGNTINEIMGFVNTEVRNLDRGTQRRLGDVLLAPQFTRAKWSVLRDATSKGGDAGSYARSAVLGNAAAALTLSLGLGYLAKQKSDDMRDLAIRALIHPSVPTPWRDNKGNTIELGLPATYTSEALGLMGVSITRGKDGHLQIAATPKNIPGNVANYGRSRLAVLPGDALKVATNTDYAGKPLYDPTAGAGTKLAQGATTIGGGMLPIGGQGLLQTTAVKSRLPGDIQQVLGAASSGTNPLLKSFGSSFGLTPKTDKTVGKGLQTTQYFSALDQAKNGLNANDKAAYNAIHQQSKNPVTGAYQTTPTIYDSQNRATTYLKNPNVLAADNRLNQQLAKDGQAVDPFYKLNPDQQNIALNYTALAQGDYRRSSFLKAYPFLNQLSADRNTFFANLPPGATTDTTGSSKPQLPSGLQYPTLNGSEQALVDKYYGATTSQKKTLLNDPATAAAVDKVKQYSANIAATRRIPTASQIPNTSSSTTQKNKSTASATRRGGTSARRSRGPTPAQIASAYTNRNTSAFKYQKSLRSIAEKASLQGMPKITTKAGTKRVATYKAPTASSRVKLGSRRSQPKKLYA